MDTPDRQTNSENGESPLYYLVREPLFPNDNPPLLLLLHGLGSNERDLFSFADDLPGKFLIVSVRAPLVAGRDSYAWYPIDFSTGKPVINAGQAQKSREIVLQFIGYLDQKHIFDDKQVFICGFSQGGIMSYAIALTHPEKIRGIAVMSGRLPEEIKPVIAPEKDLQHLGIFISHGKFDNVLDIQNAREAQVYLKKKGLNPVYKEYPVGHTISNEMFKDLSDWFNEK